MRTGDGGLKIFLWLANSPHSSNVTDSYVKSTHLQFCVEVVTITYLNSLGDLQSYGSTNAQWGIAWSYGVIGMEFPKGEVGLLL